MSRKNLAFLNVFVILLFAAGGCKAQSASAGPLTPEVTRRVQTEIRSRNNIAQDINIAISDPAPSDVTGYDKLLVTLSRGEKHTSFEFLISKDRKTLARLEKFDISKDFMSQIDTTGRPIRGNAKAKVTIVNYDDFQCPYCSRMHSLLFPEILKAYGDKVRFIYKDFPLDFHPWAMHAAVDANCLAEQNSEAYWDFADYVHANQKLLSGHSPAEAYLNLDKVALDQGAKHTLNIARLNACVKKSDESSVHASVDEGEKLGVDSTPTLFINGERVSGVIPEEDMKAIIDRALADAGEKPAAHANARN